MADSRIPSVGVLVASGALLFGACSPVPKTQLPELTPPEWQDGERSGYVVIRNDSLLYRRTILLQFDEEDGLPTLVVTNVVATESANVYFFDSTVFAMRRYSFKPLWSYRTVATEIAVSDAEARYEERRVTIRKQTIEGNEEKELRLGPHSFGIEMVQMLLRAFPLEPGRSWRITVVIPIEFRTLPMEITILGTKLAKTALGDILCREVSIRMHRRQLRLLYELAQPHRLVEIRDIDNETETRLVEFIPGQPDTTTPVVIP
ncbi:MAG: hypothetical protein ABIK44_03235 [candidate division WOR-3 bacterium]